MAKLEELIAQSYSPAEMATHAASVSTAADQTALQKVGLDLLRCYPLLPGACLMMSSLYSVALEKVCPQKGYVVAGSLHIGDQRMFGSDDDIDGKNRFSKSDPSWDGHAWIVLGDYIADVSLGRTARSNKGPPGLADHVISEFGSKVGLIILKRSTAQKSGLIYAPQYVLTQGQVDTLARGAIAQISPGQLG